MRTIALYNAFLRTTCAGLSLALAAAPASAQLRPDAAARAAQLNVPTAQGNASTAATANPAAAPVAPTAPQVVIRRILVTGTQRVEPATVLSYINLREGDVYDPAQADQALKTLYATGLFSDINYKFDPATDTLSWHVVENPIINQVVFEGNSKVSDKDLTKEVQVKPRAVFTRSKVEADVQRIVELYRRAGKFAARVDPQIIQRPQNRVDLIYSIKEGPTTGVARINFIGNKVFDSDTLKGQIATEESRWWKFLASNDNYDPDRLAYDREQLLRFYTSHGYADFHVVSAVAELSPDHENFYLTFTVSEGPRYTIGKVEVDSKIKDLPASQLRPLVPFNKGDVYDSTVVQKSIDALTNAAGTRGYAFAEVHPRLARNHDTKTIDVIFDIQQGPRVYIEKIDITGNVRTLDTVIRREFRLTEGDAFNRVLVDRSRTRIRALGFFSDVDIKDTPGSQPDRTDLTVAVTEQSTGSIQVGLGYSSQSQLVGELSYEETNLFGRGQDLKTSVQISEISKSYQMSFTEPYFLDRPLAAGFDIYRVETDFQEASYEGDTSAVVLRLNFPISEYSIVGLNYSFQIQDVTPFVNAPLQLQLAAGHTYGSIFGYSYSYNNLDDYLKPTKGMTFSFSQSIAGFGGNLKYLQTKGNIAAYHGMFADSLVGVLKFSSGYVTGYDGASVLINNRFFEGGDTFRGFSLAGIGPRDTAVPLKYGAIGGNFYAVGTIETRFNSLLPASYGVTLGLFTDFGTLGRIDNVIRECTVQSCVKDNLAFRGSAGISIGWKSPFGPVEINLGLPYAKTWYDRPQIIYFSAGTGL